MAIDDNTSYELTGYQVKDLAGRIRLKADASAIPTVNDATLTLVQNGTTVGTFTANQSTNTTVNLAGGIYADDPTAPANPDAWITNGDINWNTLNVIIDDNVPSTFFNGSYSKSFSVPVSGYYEINAPFSALAYKQANAIYNFRIKIDNIEKVRYTYASVNSSADWGTCRRTITSTPFVIELTAGTHTFSTADGNFWDTTYSLLTVTAITAKFIAPSTS